MSYIDKETNYRDLADKYSKTMNGMIDRLQGNWETLRADLLGIDANGTGLEKPGQITVFSSLKDGMQSLDEWLKKDDAKTLLNDMGEALGTAIHSVTESFKFILINVPWAEVGKTFKDIGKSVQDFIDKIKGDGTLQKLLDALPALVKYSLKNAETKLESETKPKVDLATGHPVDAYFDYIEGKVLQGYGLLGGDVDWLKKPIEMPGMSESFLTDSNANTVLNKSNLNNDQKKQIKDVIDKDDAVTYNVTIGSINANNFDEIIDSLNKQINNR